MDIKPVPNSSKVSIDRIDETGCGGMRREGDKGAKVSSTGVAIPRRIRREAMTEVQMRPRGQTVDVEVVGEMYIKRHLGLACSMLSAPLNLRLGLELLTKPPKMNYFTEAG